MAVVSCLGGDLQGVSSLPDLQRQIGCEATDRAQGEARGGVAEAGGLRCARVVKRLGEDKEHAIAKNHQVEQDIRYAELAEQGDQIGQRGGQGQKQKRGERTAGTRGKLLDRWPAIVNQCTASSLLVPCRSSEKGKRQAAEQQKSDVGAGPRVRAGKPQCRRRPP